MYILCLLSAANWRAVRCHKWQFQCGPDSPLASNKPHSIGHQNDCASVVLWPRKEKKKKIEMPVIYLDETATNVIKYLYEI